MTHRIRLALVAGILALTLTGCERDPSGIAGPSLARAPGIPAPAATPRADTAGTRAGSLIQLADAFGPGMSWYDAEGHHYEIRLASEDAGTAGDLLHYRDGELFAETVPATRGGQVSVYSGGVLVQASAPQGGPLAARAVGDGRVLLDGQHAGARPFGPRQMMAYPCQDQVNAYLVSSAELIIAGAYLQRNRASKRAITAFTAALANWGAAWNDLYNCMGG